MVTSQCFIHQLTLIKDKNHDNSSLLESLQTLQSVSIVKGHTSNNLQNDLSSNEILQRSSISKNIFLLHKNLTFLK